MHNTLKIYLIKNSVIYAHKTRRKRNIMKMSIRLETKAGLQTATNNPKTNNTGDSEEFHGSLSERLVSRSQRDIKLPAGVLLLLFSFFSFFIIIVYQGNHFSVIDYIYMLNYNP